MRAARIASPASRRDLRQVLFGLRDQLVGVRALQELYRQLSPQDDPFAFLQQALDRLGVRWQVSIQDLGRIPREGPLVVVANHPFGAVEGMVLALLLRQVRPVIRILANEMLAKVAELAPLLIPVDPFRRSQSLGRNLLALRQCLRVLEKGGALVVFPAGEVAHVAPPAFRVEEPPWQEAVVWLIRKSQARVLPVYVPGANPLSFHLAGLVHPPLRTALLPRQLLNKRGCCIRVHVGEPLRADQLPVQEDQRVVTWLRARPLLLRCRQTRGTARRRPPRPLDLPPPPEVVQGEVQRLPSHQRLVEKGSFQVFYAQAAQIPALLREIGLRREETFRLVGEGTGQSRDLDPFDRHYLHLVLWDQEQQQLAGAYRLGPTDTLLPQGGLASLYTATLFRFDPALFRRLGPALELGRSFIRPQYQRSFWPLQLLWRGIGEFVARHPRYRYLFGPVSISAAYHPESRRLLAHFVLHHFLHPELSRWVRPRCPYHLPPPKNELVWPVDGLDQLDQLVAHLESDRKGVPVLLRQYLKLGAWVLGLNVDPKFSHVLDALLLVDLLATDWRLLHHYLGGQGASRFLAAHHPSGNLAAETALCTESPRQRPSALLT
ncbi:MAG: lysophospholipid acyltransferase family protein [Thermoanaerobaculum sp.]|nr:lysophospholipid acyltransferase family protein [Thermoanaerobaculum sp.]